MQSTFSPDYEELYEQSQLRVVALQQQLHQLQKMIFGSRHERFVPIDKNNPQLSLEISAVPVVTGTITNTQKISYTRNAVAIENKPVQHPGRMAATAIPACAAQKRYWQSVCIQYRKMA